MPGVGACGAASRELPVAVDFCLAIGLGFSLDRNPRFFGGLSTQAWFPCSDGWAVFSAAASPLSSDRRHPAVRVRCSWPHDQGSSLYWTSLLRASCWLSFSAGQNLFSACLGSRLGAS